MAKARIVTHARLRQEGSRGYVKTGSGHVGVPNGMPNAENDNFPNETTFALLNVLRATLGQLGDHIRSSIVMNVMTFGLLDRGHACHRIGSLAVVSCLQSTCPTSACRGPAESDLDRAASLGAPVSELRRQLRRRRGGEQKRCAAMLELDGPVAKEPVAKEPVEQVEVTAAEPAEPLSGKAVEARRAATKVFQSCDHLHNFDLRCRRNQVN